MNQAGWTGGQYSILRVALSFVLARVFLSRMEGLEGPAWAFLGLGVVGCGLLALGWRDRAVAFNLLALTLGVAAPLDGAPLALPASDVLISAALLVLHLWVPSAPFGAWDSRGRIDPRGDWSRPEVVGQIAWILLALIHLTRGLTIFLSGAHNLSQLEFAVFAMVTAALQIAFAASTFVPRLRPYAWIALSLWLFAWMMAFGAHVGDGPLLVLHFFAAQPAWWTGRSGFPTLSAQSTDSALNPAHLFYDGDCGFCHRSVRVILSEEANTPETLRLRFAPLQGDLFEKTHAVAERDGPLPDSIILQLEDGAFLTQSAAVLEIACRLGGFWRLLAAFGQRLPAAPLDTLYDGIARLRKRVFAQPKDACPILPPDLRSRFDY